MPGTVGPIGLAAPTRTLLVVLPGSVPAALAPGTSRGRPTPGVGLTSAFGVMATSPLVLVGMRHASSRRILTTTCAPTCVALRRPLGSRVATFGEMRIAPPGTPGRRLINRKLSERQLSVALVFFPWFVRFYPRERAPRRRTGLEKGSGHGTIPSLRSGAR